MLRLKDENGVYGFHFSMTLTKIKQHALCSHQTLQNTTTIWNYIVQINKTKLPMGTHPKILGITFDPKLTYSTRIKNTAAFVHKSD